MRLWWRPTTSTRSPNTLRSCTRGRWAGSTPSRPWSCATASSRDRARVPRTPIPACCASSGRASGAARRRAGVGGGARVASARRTPPVWGAANRLALERRAAEGEVFNVGGDRAVTVLEYAGMLCELLGAELEPEMSGEFRLGDVRDIRPDASQLEARG